MSSRMHASIRDSSSDSSEDEDGDFLHPSTDPNADEFADYNPRKRRRTGRSLKESAALGIFGSESEDEGPGKRWKSKSLRGKGMSFVSSGQKRLDEDEDEDEDENEAEEEADQAADEDEDVDMENDGVAEDNTSFRGGLGMAGRGLGFRSPALVRPSAAPNSNTPLGRGFVPSSAVIPILKSPEDEQEPSPRITRPSAFSTPSRGGPAKKGLSFAERQMAKMGYKEGQGLGKDGQGRSGVIEVQLRPQGVGLGAVSEKSKQEKEEEKRQAKLRGETYDDSDEERKRRRRKPKTSGTDTGASTPRRVAKPKFRTLEEVQRAAPGLQIPEAFAPILDMTGPGQRLLTSTSGLLTPTTGTESADQVESRKLATRARKDLTAYVEEWKNLEERKAWVDMEIVAQQQDIDSYKQEFDQFEAFSRAVQGIPQAAKDGQWDPVIQALTDAEHLAISGVSDELSSIAVAAVHPFLRQATEGWQPLEDPKLNGMAPALYNIRHILGALPKTKEMNGQDSLMLNGSYRNRVKSTSPYESMIYKIIFPKIVSSIVNSWDVHNPATLQALLESWDGLLPPFLRSEILDQTVVGKLNDAISSWNPKTWNSKKRRHAGLPHQWLFPWLQYLSAHHADPKSAKGLVSDVKRKFRKLIDTWDFRLGVIPGLQQWREVLLPDANNDHWTPLIMNHVLPSMGRFLRLNFQVNPEDQEPTLPSLQGIFAWKDILKPEVIGQVIIEEVFPSWHSILHQWLTDAGPNEEIGQWFEWWRDAVFPDEIKALKSIQREFEKGHEMINEALDLGSKVKTHLAAPTKSVHVDIRKSPTRSAPPTPARPVPPVVESTFRQKVEDWCIENDLQFLPEKKVLHAGGPLFRITAAGNGKHGTLVYFKGDNLFAISKKGTDQVDVKIDWESVDAQDALLGMAWHGFK